MSVIVYPACAGETAVTRTLTVYRNNLNATITQGLPQVACRGNNYQLRSLYGDNCRWAFTYNGSTGPIRTDTYSGAIVTVTIPNDTRITSVGYVLSYNNVCSGAAAQTGGGAGVSSSGCTPGARLAAQPGEAVAPGAHPNPVSDVLTIHIPEADRDGGFTAGLHDGLQRVAWTGNTKSSTLRMDVRRLPPGMYLLRTARPSGVVTTRKVLVMH